jgi:histidinol-phosphate aminotransferase
VMDITPYKGGAADAPGVDSVIRLASNESALGPSPKAIDAYKGIASALHRYPDGEARLLLEAIGRRHGLDPAQIVCGSGSDELISLLITAYAGPGEEVLYSHVTSRTRIVFIANPNNPTGTYLSTAEMQRLRDGLPSDVILAIDAAYAEYASADNYTSGQSLVVAHDNVVMLRTFSKIYGLSALRVGWCFASPMIADVLNRVRGPFNVNAAAQAAAVAAVEDVEFEANVRAHNDRWLPWLADELVALGVPTVPSAGNFLIANFGSAARADAGFGFLKGRGILVRAVGGYGLPQYLRVAIGREDENRAVATALKAFVATSAS